MSAETEQRVPRRTGAPPKLVLQGCYQLERKLGAGGMSTAYLARDMRFGTIERWCAVKEMMNTRPIPTRAASPLLRDECVYIGSADQDVYALAV